ncbi:MAG: DISARM system phospholipase D-like protein DrmC [Methylomonas sp.]|jgi:phosphatidylserine/phosphatidylglycerophosphate/cardiolipin synthase-like enzyme|uniref:DISARM system phospholipase D-like protein DrmC n=1 Tax=Methylomonas sp. TaxID=418 RepID=UPI0025EBAF5C|nr:DISARM system phospholipase D-like protein DrmC [Methylomonas sp.]MCK9608834.1 DISARM system phospholipase D-like protein DrmC [Methylomonas sp.]
MKALLDAVTELVTLVPREKIDAIANRIRKSNSLAVSLTDFESTHQVASAIARLKKSWQTSEVSASELAAMLIASSHTIDKINAEQSLELVWTGPTTPFVSARRTEQALLQVIESARKTLFITSFVAYDVSSIINALNIAVARGAIVSMLLESSSEHGGSMSMDVIGKMRKLVPNVVLYAWTNKTDPFSGGRVHAKIALADGHSCFITSANLTGFAMEKNMEAGVLVNGGRVPVLLERHLNTMIELKIVDKV